MEKVAVEIKRSVFEKLQSLAEPLIDDTDSVIEKLINHWREHPPKTQRAELENKPKQWWISPRGERFPVGLKLRAKYKGNTYEANILSSGIHFQSDVFTSPSAAAIHAKNLSGLIGASANTDGWKFWEYYDAEADTWRDLRLLRKKST